MRPDCSLLLRHFSLEDAPFILELLNTETWLKYIGDKGVRDLDEARNYILNGPLKHYESDHLGLKVITWKSNNEESGLPVGVCGLLKRPYLEYPDIGYALLPDYVGRGFVHWAIGETIGQLSVENGPPLLYAITDPGNKKSQKVLVRNRFVFKEERLVAKDTLHIYQRNL